MTRVRRKRYIRPKSKVHDRKCSEIFRVGLSYDQGDLLKDKRRWRLLSNEGQLQVTDNPVDGLVVCDEGNDLHLAATLGTYERIDLSNLANHGLPAAARESASDPPQSWGEGMKRVR